MVDSVTNKTIGVVDLAASQLPDSFDGFSTTMHVGDAEWQVSAADPVDRAGYTSAARLTLRLRRIDLVAPSEILFSLPTLEDRLPATRPPDGTFLLNLHEDDWRQVEFVAGALLDDVQAEFTKIRAIVMARRGVGFERLHVRTTVPEPLAGVQLTLEEVVAALGGAAPAPLGIGGLQVVDGFASSVNGGAVYGIATAGRVHVLGLHGGVERPVLRGLLPAPDLMLVDWVRTSVGP